MNQNLKDLILSEHPEDNALAVAILKTKWWNPIWRIKRIVIRTIKNEYFYSNEHLHDGVWAKKIWSQYHEVNIDFNKHFSEPLYKFKYD